MDRLAILVLKLDRSVKEAKSYTNRYVMIGVFSAVVISGGVISLLGSKDDDKANAGSLKKLKYHL